MKKTHCNNIPLVELVYLIVVNSGACKALEYVGNEACETREHVGYKAREHVGHKTREA